MKTKMNKILSALMCVAIFFSTSGLINTRVSANESPATHSASQNESGVILVNGALTTYCMDMERDFIPGSMYYESGVNVTPEVLFIINNSYPVLTAEQTGFLWGLTGLTEKEAYDATQLAIWKYTNPNNAAELSARYGAIALNAQALYDKLIAGAGAVSGGYTPAARFNISLDATKAGRIKLGNAAEIAHGPYKITSADIPNPPSDLYVTVGESGGSAPTYSIRNAEGKLFTDGKIPLDTEFYVFFSSEFSGTFQLSFSLNGAFTTLPYVTKAVYLESINEGGQPILYHESIIGTPAQTATVEINTSTAPAGSGGLTISKTTATPDTITNSESFTIAVYVMNGTEVIQKFEYPDMLTLENNITADIYSYEWVGYDVVVVEEWENSYKIYDKDIERFVTQTTSVVLSGGSSGGSTMYFALENGNYSVKSTYASKPTSIKHYVGYKFKLDNLKSSRTLEFTNNRYQFEFSEPEITLTKEYQGPFTNKYNFFLYHVRADGFHTYIGKMECGNRESADVYGVIKAAYENGVIPAYIGETFVIVEDWTYYQWESLGLIERRSTSTSMDQVIGYKEKPTGVSGYFSRGTYGGSSDYIYPVYEFAVTDDDQNIRFYNWEVRMIESLQVTPNSLTIKKEYLSDELTEFRFNIYEVNTSGNYIFNRSFTLKNGESYDLIQELNIGSRYKYFRTYVIVEDWKYAGDPYLGTSSTSINTAGHFYFGSQRVYFQSMPENGSEPVTGAYSAQYPYPGIKFDVSADYGYNENLSITFTNSETRPTLPTVTLNKSFAQWDDETFTFALYSIKDDAWELLKDDIDLGKDTSSADLFSIIKNRYPSSYFNYEYVLVEQYANKAATNSATGIGTTITSAGVVVVSQDTKYSTGGATPFDVAGSAEAEWYPGIRFKLSSTVANQSITFTNLGTTPMTIPVMNIEKAWTNNQFSPDGATVTMQVLEVDGNGQVISNLGSISREPSTASTDVLAFIRSKYSGSEYLGKSFIIYEEYGYADGYNGVNKSTAITLSTDSVSFFNASAGYVAGKLYGTGDTIAINETPVSGAYPAVKFTFPGSASSLPDSTILFTNKYVPAGGFTLHKLNSKSVGYLVGAQFKLYHWVGDDIADYANETAIRTIDVSAPGGVPLENLPYGDYALIETRSPNEYRQNNVVRKVTVSSNASANNVTVLNTHESVKVGKVSIMKVDEAKISSWKAGDAVSGLTGARFKVFAYINEEIGYLEISALVEQGKTGVYSLDLPAGRYYIVEDEAPAGYEKSDTKYYFTMQDVDGVVVVTEFSKDIRVTNNGEYLIPNKAVPVPVSPTTVGKAPKTGDESNMVWFIALLVSSICGIAVLRMLRGRKKKSM